VNGRDPFTDKELEPRRSRARAILTMVLRHVSGTNVVLAQIRNPGVPNCNRSLTQPNKTRHLDRERVLFYSLAAMRDSSGFTLIEALLVVAVIGVLAGMTAPVVSAGLDRYEVISTSQQVAGTIRSARYQAVGKNMILRVKFDFPEEGQFQIVDADDNAVGSVQYLDDDISFGDFTDLEFSTAGRLTSGVAASIVITNGDAAHDRTIAVSKNGQVELHTQSDEESEG
jgi:prepilin-type N-terminal cleavage/methylation domain-containing protein